jgi:hypothetical protein
MACVNSATQRFPSQSCPDCTLTHRHSSWLATTELFHVWSYADKQSRFVLQMQALLSVVNASVLHVDIAVRSAAGSCLTHFLKGYACDELLECSTTYCHLLEDGATNRRIGGAVALRALPYTLAAPRMERILPQLCRAVHASTAKDHADVDARVAAIEVRNLHSVIVSTKCLRLSKQC